MAISNYATLKTTVALYLHRSDLTSNIPSFIELAERRISRDVKNPPMVTNTAVVVLAAGNVALPANFMGMVNVKIEDGGAELFYSDPDAIDRVTGSGTPWLYTIMGNKIFVAPLPSATTTMVTTYRAKEAVLSDANQTNWYTENSPDILLYASLLEAAPFLASDARVATWGQLYASAVQSINRQFGVDDTGMLPTIFQTEKAG